MAGSFGGSCSPLQPGRGSLRLTSGRSGQGTLRFSLQRGYDPAVAGHEMPEGDGELGVLATEAISQVADTS